MTKALGACVLCSPVTPGPPTLVAAKGIIDATTNAVPWNDPSSMIASSTMPVIGPRALTDVNVEPHTSFVVIGGGKSACDAILYMRRAMGVGPTEDCPRIKWIVSTALAYFRREVAGTNRYNQALEDLLQEDFANPDAEMHALPSYGVIFHHFTTTPPNTTHLGVLSVVEVSELRVQSRIEGQRAVSIEHDHIILTNERLDCSPGTIIVTCTGPARDATTRARLQAEHTAMRDKRAVYMSAVGALLWLAAGTPPISPVPSRHQAWGPQRNAYQSLTPPKHFP